MTSLTIAAALLALSTTGVFAADAQGQSGLKARETHPDVAYILGPDDELSIQVAELEQIGARPLRIDPNGILHLPVAGNIKAAGLPVDELEAVIADRLSKTLNHPEVSINVSAFHSQPVSVMGAVNQPGVHQLQGPSRLLEMISSAGGLRPDAGSTVRITRQKEAGPIPLDSARADSSGLFSLATLNTDDLTKGIRPEQNIYLRAHDIISVDKADLVYVVGEVRKAGGFTLSSHEHISILQALSLAEGLAPTAGAKNARILRKGPESAEREEIHVNVRRILDGQAPDLPLHADDILFIPNNIPKSVSIRAAEAALQVGTGLVIWRR